MTASDQSPFRVAFVGAGGIAKTHADAIGSLGGRVQITAAADPDRGALKSFTDASGARGFASAGELYGEIESGQTPADAVIVCTPPSVREEVIEPALRLGLGVLLEKPIARTAEEGAALCALGEAHPDTPVALGYCHRFTPAVLEMRRMTSAGEIGRLTRFENVFAFHHPPMGGRWFSDPAVSGGGSLIDTGSHSLDLFQFLAGTPEVVGALADHDWNGRGESSATVLVRAREGEHPGVAGLVLAGWLEPTRFHLRLVGTEGMVFYDYENPTELLVTRADGSTETRAVETHEVRFARQIEAFARACQGDVGARAAGLATLEDGLAVAHAVDSLSDPVKL